MPQRGVAGLTMEQVRARKRAMSPEKLKAKKERDGFLPEKTRAYVRVGKNNTKILLGEEDITTWDDEELLWGKRRDKNGGFQGRVPTVIPKVLYDEIVRRTLTNANETMRVNLEAAIEMLCSLAIDKRTEPKDKLKAISMIMDRVMGKTPDKIEVTAAAAPWEDAIADALISIDDDDVIDVESEEA